MSDETLPERLKDAERELQLAKGKSKLYQAAKKLVDKLEVVHNSEEYKGIWAMAFIHGSKYNGPTYEQELKDLKQTIQELEVSNNDTAGRV